MKLTTGYKKPIASSGTDALELSTNNSYLLLAGGGHKALSELVSPADLTTELSNYVTIGSNLTITGVKTFSQTINADITGDARTLNGYTSDDFVLKTTHDVYESVIAEALNDLDSRKVNIADIPTSLPANGGNADYATSAGNASSAAKLTSSAGSATLPIYFSDGVPVACNASSVFSNLSNSGNDLSVTVAGQNRTLTVAYASSAGTLGGYTADKFIQNIKVGTVITGNPGTSARVTATKTNSEVTLDFTIPRGDQGDMAEKEDSGYTDSNGDTVVDYCEAILEWQFLSDPGLNCEFVNILQVPIPSYDLITSLIDCIKMTQKVTLLVGDKGQTYTWDQLHWSLQCSNKDGIVYVTKYGTNHTNFYFGVDNNNNGDPINAINTIEIVVRCEPDQTDSTVGVYYIQVTVENKYGRAYYTSTKISQIVIT